MAGRWNIWLQKGNGLGINWASFKKGGLIGGMEGFVKCLVCLVLLVSL